jgi:hypothetical protein
MPAINVNFRTVAMFVTYLTNDIWGIIYGLYDPYAKFRSSRALVIANTPKAKKQCMALFVFYIQKKITLINAAQFFHFSSGRRYISSRPSSATLQRVTETQSFLQCLYLNQIMATGKLTLKLLLLLLLRYSSNTSEV